MSAAQQQEYAIGRGTLLSVLSSLGFGLLYLWTPLIDPLDPAFLVAMRLPLGVLSLIALFAAQRQPQLIADSWRHLCAKPVRFLALILCGSILTSQLWLFAYGPMNGLGLQVALGFLLLPLALVVVGRVLYKDKLSVWHWVAIGLAAAGVTQEVVRAGGLSPAALWVVGTYPIYFILRRAIGMNNLGGMFWEMLAMCVPASIFIIWYMPQVSDLELPPNIWLIVPGVAFIGSASLVSWILSSKLLPISTFGMLSYLEPALLMGVSLLLGERITPAEYPLYICIWVAIIIIIAVSAKEMRIERRRAREIAKLGKAITPVITDQPAPATGSIPIIQPEDESEN
ncbi:EamA family transporter [Canibacter zhoujuaniae]|uniref:EamA family transporter n=1 Tax=Canibacter zhoujuaniae TaxID=2708343 RepID=UPI0014200FB8|nr:EamA family transporter RarD [Canibacter zhoujuaniae]